MMLKLFEDSLILIRDGSHFRKLRDDVTRKYLSDITNYSDSTREEDNRNWKTLQKRPHCDNYVFL